MRHLMPSYRLPCNLMQAIHIEKTQGNHSKIHKSITKKTVAFQIAELFICNERCIQAGIGYIPSLIMLLSFSIAFIKNCLM
ncbi:unnamed protein product [Angiostrongylus costaricensis]|uniref:Ovule protein n=1 Tax=Angiostrongylus costaricensis TaxID=334426 RepID=A0A0R3PWJ2_ANGCS|nr:unnamed protein product [Angiostrongylus costaricensis]